MLLRRLFREPLAWFFVAGAIIFALAPRGRSGDGALHVSRRSLTSLAEAEARRRHVTTLPPAVAAAVERQALDDELLYREGLRLGVDKNDNIVRQRVIEKMLFLADDLAGSARPVSDAVLDEYMRAHADAFARPALVSFVQVFAATDETVLTRILPTLARGVDGAEPPNAGEAFLLGRRAVDTPLGAIEKSYGKPFATAISALPVGEWSQPIRSQYGFHLVKVVARRDSGVPPLADIRGAVRLAYTEGRKARAAAELLRDIRARQRIVIDESPDAVSITGGRAVGDSD